MKLSNLNLIKANKNEINNNFKKKKTIIKFK